MYAQGRYILFSQRLLTQSFEHRCCMSEFQHPQTQEHIDTG